MRDGILVSGLMLSEGIVVSPNKRITMSSPESGVEKSGEREVMGDKEEDNVEVVGEEEDSTGVELRKEEDVCLGAKEEASALGEAEGVTLGGNAVEGEGRYQAHIPKALQHPGSLQTEH